MRKTTPWHLHHIDSSVQKQFATIEEAFDHLRSHDRHDQVYAWQEGLTDWTPVLELPQFEIFFREPHPSTPPVEHTPPPPLPISSKAPAAPQFKRKHERFDLKFRVIVRSKQITFRTFSKNISLGGIAVEHPVPNDLINEDCLIYIGDPETSTNLKFQVKFATERKDTKYFYFTEISPQDQDQLKVWIEKHHKKVLPKAA